MCGGPVFCSGKQGVCVAFRFHPAEYRLEETHVEFLVEDLKNVTQWAVTDAISVAIGGALSGDRIVVASPDMVRRKHKLMETVADMDKMDWEWSHGDLQCLEHTVFYFKDRLEEEKVLTEEEIAAMTKKLLIKKRKEARAKENKRYGGSREAALTIRGAGNVAPPPVPAETGSEGEEGGAPQEGLTRTFSSDVYTKMLANPNISATQRAKIEAMRARRFAKEEGEGGGEVELQSWLQKTDSRRNLAARRKEREILRQLQSEDAASSSLQRRTASAQDRADVEAAAELLSLEQNPGAVAAMLAETNTEVEALKRELGL
eukprot:SAG11_NODE_5734_length_1476_cov_1.989833_1_plen_317_part_00